MAALHSGCLDFSEELSDDMGEDSMPTPKFKPGGKMRGVGTDSKPVTTAVLKTLLGDLQRHIHEDVTALRMDIQVPGLAQNITVNNKNTTNSLSVNWTIPAGKVDNYTVTLNGDVNRTITTNSTQVDFTDLLPGRNYSIAIQTVSSNCSQSAAPVIEATYPTPPVSLNVTNIGTNYISLSWGEPVNMTNVTKSFNIIYSNSSSSWTVTVNTLNVTLQNLTSGTNYTITVVTVGSLQYQSSPVTISAFTKPMPVKQLGNNGTTTVSVFLIWNQPDEYRSDYTYRVQIVSPSSVVINQTASSNQLNVTNLTPGVTYTFTVFTRAADNVTESQSVSYTTCTVPGLAQNITVNNKNTTNSLSVNWTIPAGKVDNYTVTLNGDVNRTITTNSTQVDFTDLLPGRNYSITIQTVSSNCSQSAAPVIEATYPTLPVSLNVTNIGTNYISLSWGEPVNMTNVTKSFNIIYSNSSSSWTVTVNTLNVTLQNLTSGTNYTITVVTVGSLQYQSSPVTISAFTKPMPVKQLGNNGTTTVSVFLIWNQPDEYRSDYTYRVQIVSPSSVVINQTASSNQLNVTNLTPGVTYTFTVFTRAADNVTESQSVSYTTCTVPGLAQNITVNNKNTTNSLRVNWTIPAGKVDNYTVTLNGDVNRTITTNSTQVDFTDLLPGRNYSITIQTVSSNCSQSAAPVIEATYPTLPVSLNVTNIGTNYISLSWGEPVNMTNVTKSFNIIYSNSSSSWTVTVNTLNVTLQNLTSGTNYTITVVTVGSLQYQSSPVTISAFTKPMPVKQLGNNGTTTVSVFLIWNQPDEYRSDYTYRVQIVSPSSVVINQTASSNQLNVTNLTPGVTYTFTVFTRAADNVTESQSVSYTTCTVPGLAQNITVNNKNTTNSLRVNWTIPAGKVDNYTVTLNGDVNRTITTNSTQVDFTDLLPGRNYSITIQTVSSNCSQSAAPVIEATYPTLPVSLNVTNIGTNYISLSWGEPVNMTNVTKSFNIIYSNSSSSWTVTVNTLNVTLQNLTSGTNYTITVVTVGSLQYQSSPVTISAFTKPMPVKQLGNNGTTTVSVFLIWNQPDEYRSDYTYRVQIVSPSSVVINQTASSNQLNVTNLTPGVTYTFTVFTRAADNVTESQSVSYTTCTVPGLAQNITVNNKNTTNSLRVNWTIPAGKVDNYTVTLNGDVNRTITTNSTQVDFTDLLPGRNYSITIQTVSSNCSQSAAPVIEATYPTLPVSLNVTNIGTNYISLSWGEPVNMTNVTKSFNIIYSNSSSSWTVTVNTLNVTLQNLTSGTNYTITVVTVGSLQYQSSPVTISAFTKPMPVKQLGNNGTTTVSVFLIWNQPDEYRSDYTYRVEIVSPSSVVINQTASSNQLNVTNLTAGVTYTFTVFTRAADNVTESQSVSYTTCTVPGLAQNITVNNKNTTNSLRVNWTIPGKVDNYTVTLNGDVNRTITTNSTQVDFTDLLPGRNYSITIQTVSSNCSQSAAPVIEATYPSLPVSLNVTNIGTNYISLSWGEPVNMTNVTKSFNIIYSNSSFSWTVTVNTLNVTLQNLTSGTNYTITVVTVGSLQYQSSPVTISAFTKPMPVKQLGNNGTTTVSVFLIWNQPDEYRSDYTYRVQIVSPSSVVINQTASSNQLNVTNLTPGVTYTFTVFTRAADNVTESQSVSYTTCTVPGLAQNITVNNKNTTNSLSVNWTIPAGKVDNYTVTLSGDVNRTITTNSTQVDFTDLLPGRNYSITIQTVSSNCSQSAAPVIEATYPTPPVSLNVTNIGTNYILLSWEEPVNMTNVTKSFNIIYTNSSSSWTVTVNSLNVTLQNLTSGTNYTITVVTVGSLQYQSSPVTISAFTKPMPVKQLGNNGTTTVSVFLIWNQPDEYRSDYTYRVEIVSPSSVVINQTASSNQLNVTNLTPGVTYTFTVFTRAADNVTESPSVSYTTCTVPGLAQNITVNNKNTTNSLSVNWTIPAGKVDNYTVTLNGDVNRTITTNSTQVDFTDLLPGRNYSITIQTVSSNCSQSAAPVIEATYPTLPVSLNVTNIGTNYISLSWGEPVNMTNVTKSFNIIYSNSSSSWTVTVNTLNVTLQNLTSGTNYTITVVTVGSLQYQSSPVTISAFTKPMPVKQLGNNGTTTVSVFLIWNQPDEYRSDYTYRVEIVSPSSVVINQTASSNQLNVTNLTAGVTYTFTVFTRAADNVTESQSVSYTTCTVPDLAQNITVTNNNTTNSLSVNWTIPAEKVDNYTVTLNGDVNRTITTNSTQVDFTDLLPGRNYSITIQTVSSNCSQSAAPVIEATYPTPPVSLSFTNIETNTVSLSWEVPVNMTNVTKTFNINYSNSSSSWTVTVNPLNVTLQNLTSGTNYTITVVTVGARQYQSSPVTVSAFTKPMPVKQLGNNRTTTVSVFLIWNHPDEYRSDYTYRVQIENTSSVVINQTTASNQLNVTNLTPGITYTFTVFTQAADNVTESQSVSYTTSTGVNWILTQPDEPPSSNQISFSFPEFENTNGPIKSYAVIVTTGENVAGQVPSRGILNKTYDDFKNKKTNTYVSNIKETASRTLRSLMANSVTVIIGAGDKKYGYYNGPLEPSTSYWISVAGFTDIEFDNATGTILEDRSVATFSPFSNEIKTSGNSSQNTSQNSEPKTVKLLRDNDKTSSSVSLIWGQPDEYQAEYRYRILTTSASSAVINEIIVTNQTVNVTNLTPGETYTFTVFTRAADNVTESQSVSYTTCTVPGLAQNITVNNKNTTNSLSVNWTIPAGKVDNYTVTLNGDVNRTITTNSTQVDFTDLLPGRNYSITIQTVSSNCSQSAAPVIEATYPTSPGSFYFTDIGTNTISLSWGEPANITNVTKTFSITYSNSSSSWTVSVNTLNVTLQNLTSGTNYTITVVTVGARQYQSSPVISSIFTKPMPVKQLGDNGTTTVSVFLTWNQPDEYRSDYTYRVQAANTSSVVINQTTASNQLNVTNLTPGVTYTFTVFTRAADNVTESQSVSYTTSTGVNWILTQPDEPPSSNQISFSFPEFENTNGPIKSYAVIVTTGENVAGQVPSRGILNKTYDDFKNKETNTYVSNIKEMASRTLRSLKANSVTVIIGAGDKKYGYYNGPLEPSTSYWISVAGFTAIEYDNATGTILEDRSVATFSPFSNEIKTSGNSSQNTSQNSEPKTVKLLRDNDKTSSSVSLIWGQPDEYQAEYRYRILTTSASSAVINEMIVTNQTVNITNLTPGETYTFTVFTRAADNVTESQSVSYTTCTVPGLAQNITVNNKNTNNSLSVNWTIPAGKVDNYTVTLNGDVNRTITTNSTQVDFTDLLPGRNYSITIQTVSSNCSQSAAPVIEATYPTSPGSFYFTDIGTNTISLSWGEPVNITNVTKTFSITYSNSSSSRTVAVNTLNVTLQNLTSGTNYTITVVTVGARQYQSSPVISSIFTKPMPVKQLGDNGTTTVSVFLIWNQPDEYRSDYTYRVQIENTSSVVINQTASSNQLNVTNLTPGVTYTFTVFTRAADNVTESQSVSYTTCTVPGLAQNITVNNKNTTNSLSVNWTIPAGKVDNYTVTLNGDVNRTITTNSTQVDFTDLLPGRNYSITIQTVSSNCNQSGAPVIEATYPPLPVSLNVTNIGTNYISLSWGEPVNMTNVTKSFNIIYSNSSSSWTVTVNTLNVTLQNLTSGNNYTITVVTVGSLQYQSSPVTISAFTKPMPVKQLGNNGTTTVSVFLIWNQPDEYRSDYTYRVQIVSPLSVVINQTASSNQLNVTNLTPGVTYTFTVFTRAADNVTESQSVSYTTCTVPGLAQNITVNNKNATNSLSVNWTIPAGKVDNYTVTLNGDVNRTITTNSTQVDFTDLLPGRNYSITIQTASSNCSQSAAPVIEATYPTLPVSLNVTNIGTNYISLSWGEPVNMTNVTKSFNIIYSNSSSSWTVTVNTLSATLQNLTSGTNYTITVVTVGSLQYQSSPVTISAFTKPMPVKQLGNNGTTTVSVFLIWNQPDEYRSDYTYRVQIVSPSSVVINQTASSNQLNVTNLTPGVTYTFTVFTRAADNVTESQSVSYTTCTVPGLAQNITVNNKNTTNSLSVNWTIPAGKVDNYTVTLNGDVNRTITTNSTQVDFTDLLPGRNYSITIQTVSSNCSQSAAPVIEATYPTLPVSLNVTNIGTNYISLSWGEPVNMTNVTKSFNIIYNNSSSSWTVTVNTLNVTLQNLTSGTNYTITVVTVGSLQYQSSPVTISAFTMVEVLWTPRHLRDKNTPMLPTSRLTLQMWDYLHKRHTSTTKFSSWAPITTLHSISPWLSLHKWKDKGITHITDICHQGTILPFPDIQLKYTLPPSYIFPYLQLKSIIKEKVQTPTQHATAPNLDLIAIYNRCQKTPIKAKALSLGYAVLGQHPPLTNFDLHSNGIKKDFHSSIMFNG
ncbi:titin isoform X1 [Pelobates cultripes]|uniref:protein-tyrosine-phosphatase n=1 Tax=Pelobates cultripes TaxID=61616 RepID=A0AAD1TFB4_PELCU|nr:titin isoform X1 [Pelobates cultripes]